MGLTAPQTHQALIIMAKRPFPGRTKTRLSPPFSAEEAADLYEHFLCDAIELVRRLPDVIPFIAYAPGEGAVEYFRQLVPDFELIPQLGSTLGERLDYVLSACLEAGYQQVAAMNSDGPTLPVAYLAQAFEHLADAATDVVLGPCEDGGYYLIGWKRPFPRLVRNVQMSTPHVLQDTLAIAAVDKLQVALLPCWYDVDNATDLARVQADLQRDSRIAPYTRRFLASMRVVSGEW